jgi:hypothetical protein
MKIIKHSGKIVDFNRDKLKQSLLRSGAEKSVVENVLHNIEKEMYEGMPTKQIYKIAFALLKKSSKSHAARYNLKAAIQQLGPAGFFFEKFIARVFEADDYETKTNLSLQGKCVIHEIDVVLKKNGTIWMAECKFHNSREANSDVKVPMYILSRFNDVKDNNHAIFGQHDRVSQCLIVTNNRFTTDAITFASCSALELLSWDHPKENSLKSRIDTQELYPVTCLTTLSLVEKEKILIMDIILVKELLDNPGVLERISISPNRIKNVLKEASELCNYI